MGEELDFVGVRLLGCWVDGGVGGMLRDGSVTIVRRGHGMLVVDGKFVGVRLGYHCQSG